VHTTILRGALVVLLLLSAACGSSGPTSPTVTPPSPVVPPPVPAPTPSPTKTFPPLSGPSRTFVFDRGLLSRVSDYTRKSSFVLYDNGAFVLRYSGPGEYRGGYTETNGVVTFEWEGWSAAGPWGATGTMRGDSLAVEYNFIMQMTDFENAVYARTP
jgi:hypothetical protein